MSKHSQKSDRKGSLKCIQQLVNLHPELFNKKISEELKQTLNIKWVSPLSNDRYSEYRDKDFLKRIELDPSILKLKLDDFWPLRGPQWDALGVENGKKFIVEAKANLREMFTPPTSATYKSLKLIKKSLNDTKEYLSCNSISNWSSVFYQYTNRLAHLYYLNVKNKVNTFLVFVYFTGDKTVNGPISKDEWIGAITLMKQYLGINKKHKLSKSIVEIFVDKSEIS